MSKHQHTYLLGALGLVAIGSFASIARADDDVPPTSDAPAGQFAVMRGVQGPAGMVSARVLLDINLSADAVGKPISLAPDLFYSATDKFQLGIVHQGPIGWQTRPGPGLCLTGTDNGCPHLYDNIGFDAMLGLLFAETSLSAHGTLFINTFDPTTQLGLGVGFAGKTRFGGKAALVYDPKVVLALNERDTVHDALFIPLELELQLGAPDTLRFLSGVFGDLSAFGDTYQIPLGIGFVHNLNPHLDLGARFSFDNLLGVQPMGVGRADARSLALLINLRS